MRRIACILLVLVSTHALKAQMVQVERMSCISEISGKVFVDKHRDGLSTGDVGLPNYYVYLYTSGGTIARTAVTDALGQYSMTYVNCGDYYIRFQDGGGTGYTLFSMANIGGNDNIDSDVTGANGAGSTNTFNVQRKINKINIDAGLYKCKTGISLNHGSVISIPHQISGDVWYDLNKDGIYQDIENGINGLTVQLYQKGSASWNLFATTTTIPKPGTPSDDGYYGFSCVPNAEYYVSVGSPGGLKLVSPNQGADDRYDSEFGLYNGYQTSPAFKITRNDSIVFLHAGFGNGPTITSFTPASAVFTPSTMQAGVPYTGTLRLPYSGADGCFHSALSVSSTGVTGLIATLAENNLNIGSGELVFNLTGTPSATGTANFSISLAGASCVVSKAVPITPTVTTLTGGALAFTPSTVSQGQYYTGTVLAPYTGGNGVSYPNGVAVASTGVLGLTATLQAGILTSGMGGNLTYVVTGTPTSSGTANFNISFGGRTATITKTVTAPLVSALNCAGAALSPTPPIQGTYYSGILTLPYTGGNGAAYAGLTVNSTGVTGLAATLTQGTLAVGSGNLVFTVTGSPTSYGTASFPITLAGRSCTFTVNITNACPLSLSMQDQGSDGWEDFQVQVLAAGRLKLELYDSGNDGWNGFQLDIAYAGVSQGTYTLSTGPSGFYYVNIPSPGTVTVTVLALGSKPNEVSYRIYDPMDVLWFQKNAPHSLGISNSVAMACTGCTGGVLAGPYTLASGASGVQSIDIPSTPRVIALDVTNLGIFPEEVSYNLRKANDSIWAPSPSLNILGRVYAGIINTGCGAKINAFTCASAALSPSTITSGVYYSGAMTVPYTGGNGLPHTAMLIASTGVTGLTATLNAGTLNTGAGNLTFSVTGTANASGTATFTIVFGSQTCVVDVTVI